MVERSQRQEKNSAIMEILWHDKEEDVEKALLGKVTLSFKGLRNDAGTVVVNDDGSNSTSSNAGDSQ
jgi:hypothetical protein